MCKVQNIKLGLQRQDDFNICLPIAVYHLEYQTGFMYDSGNLRCWKAKTPETLHQAQNFFALLLIETHVP